MFFLLNLTCAIILTLSLTVAIGSLIFMWCACGIEKIRVWLGFTPLRLYSFRGLWARFFGVKP